MERKTADDVRFCEVVQDLLPLYVDGALKRGSMELVEEHLKTCADCRGPAEPDAGATGVGRGGRKTSNKKCAEHDGKKGI